MGPGMGLPCPHWTQFSGFKEAGAKFQRRGAKGRTLKPPGTLPERDFLFGAGGRTRQAWDHAVWVSAPLTPNPLSFHSSQLWAPRLPAPTAQSGRR